MSVIGINSIVLQPASVVLPGELSPPPELARLFDALPALFDKEDVDGIRDTLDAITQWDSQPDQRLPHSQNVRQVYWMGRFMSISSEFKQAAALFLEGLTLVAEHQNQDYATKIDLALCIAETLHNNLQCRDALEYYELAYSFLLEAFPEPVSRPRDTEIQLLNYVGRQYWSIGEFEKAHGIFARTYTAGQRMPKRQKTNTLRKEIANALWMIGLILRVQSDGRNGDSELLNTAIRRMRKAQHLYADLGLPAYVLARFNIQVADVYFDLAELHQANRMSESARSMLLAGLPLADQAVDFIKLSEDTAGHLLADITRLRFDGLWADTRAPVQQIAEKLRDIERQGAEINDRFVLAKAATLRADWLIRRGEVAEAREFLQLAIEGFGEDGKGMATRAERLMRQLPPVHEPENHYGSADPERNGHN